MKLFLECDDGSKYSMHLRDDQEINIVGKADIIKYNEAFFVYTRMTVNGPVCRQVTFLDISGRELEKG